MDISILVDFVVRGILGLGFIIVIIPFSINVILWVLKTHLWSELPYTHLTFITEKNLTEEIAKLEEIICKRNLRLAICKISYGAFEYKESLHKRGFLLVDIVHVDQHSYVLVRYCRKVHK